MAYPILHFREPLEERWLISGKGWYNGLTVEIEDGFYKVFFYDPTRLSQDLETEPFVAEIGLIVVPNITEDGMRSAVQKLYDDGRFFKSFRPVAPPPQDQDTTKTPIET